MQGHLIKRSLVLFPANSPTEVPNNTSVNHGYLFQLMWSKPRSPPKPDPSPHAFTAEARSSENRREPSLPWGQNFWDTDCEDSKVLVYATEVLVWLLGGHSYGLCLLSELQIVGKRGGSNYNPSAPGRWIPATRRISFKQLESFFLAHLLRVWLLTRNLPTTLYFFQEIWDLFPWKYFCLSFPAHFSLFNIGHSFGTSDIGNFTSSEDIPADLQKYDLPFRFQQGH